MTRKLLSLGAAIIAGAVAFSQVPTSAQQQPAGQQPQAGQAAGGRQGAAGGGQGQGEGRGGGGRQGGGGGGQQQAPAIAADDTAGFTSIFDGKSLTGWDGDPMFWRVENGIIVAESTPEKQVTSNTFLIWRGGQLKNFELKASVRFAAAAGNSDIQIRSKARTESPGRDGGPAIKRPWGIAGYQVDVVNAGGTGTALIYEEGGRGFLARQGQITRRVRDAQGNPSTKLIGTLGDNIPASIKAAGDWNSFHIVGVDNQITVAVNGRVSAIVIDDDAEGRSLEGLLALQMHVGAPFRVEFRDIFVKHLP